MTVPVTFVVEINEENEANIEHLLLAGDSAIVATRRAIWCLFSTDRLTDRKKLGVRRFLVQGSWENMAEEIRDDVIDSPLSPGAEISDDSTLRSDS